MVKRGGIAAGKAAVRGAGATVAVVTELALADSTSKDADIDKKKMMQWEKANPYGSAGRVDSSQKTETNNEEQRITNSILDDIKKILTTKSHNSGAMPTPRVAHGTPY